MSIQRFVAVVTAYACLLAGIQAEENKVAAKPEEAKGLAQGDEVPKVSLKTAKGETFDLLVAVKAKPTVLIFYRGGWCPYCNSHLSELQKIEPDLKKLGYQILAISPESPESLSKTTEKDNLSYTLLSDSANAATRAFKLAFKMDDATIEKYKSFKLDLSAHDWTLPVPAAFVISQDGMVKFAHVNPDYKNRIDAAVLLEKAKEAIEKP